MDSAFYEYRFSRHFNRLAFLGMWPTDTRGVPLFKKILRLILHLVFYVMIAAIVVLQMYDLYLVLDDFEKVTFNLSSSTLVVGLLIKFTLMYQRRECLNKLRVALWRDYQKIDEPEDLDVIDRAYGLLNMINNAIYSLVAVVISVLWVTHWYGYWKGSTELPFAAYLPINYPSALSLEMVGFIYVAFITAENELVGFSLLLQVIAHYDVLKNKLRRLDEVYRKEANAMKEVKALIKYCVRRNLELMEYVNMMEHIYNRCMLFQLFVGGFMIMSNSLVLLVFARGISRKLCYQLFEIFIFINNLLFICYCAWKLSMQCLDLGNTAYSTAWYRMDVSTQKSLYMLMIGSRRPPKMTAGKIILLDLHTYVLVLRNSVSWLMLIRQLFKQKKLAAETS